MNKSVLVIGATGFVAQALIRTLVRNYDVKGLGRKESDVFRHEHYQYCQIKDLSEVDFFDKEFEGVDTVIHTAARVHIMEDEEDDPLNAYRQINTKATLLLANQAVKAGVKRFIFISSVKVNGEVTQSGEPFSAEDKNIPEDPYGLSKYEAEQGLLQLAGKTNLEVVIIRPPLVYGPNVKANFASLIRVVNRSLPLPLGAIHNQRSLVAVDNLVDFIIHCIEHPAAANEIFVICDDEDVSTTTLLKKIALAYDKRLYLFPIPPKVMSCAAKMLGKGKVVEKLFGNLQVDCTKAKYLLGWKPIISMDEQLAKMAEFERVENEKRI